MKKIILVVFLSFHFVIFSQSIDYKKKLNEFPSAVLKDYNIINDKFENATNIFSKSSDGAKIKLNIRIKESDCVLRLYSFYSAGTWLFIDSISFLIDDKTYKIDNINSGNKQIGIGQGIAERTYTIVDDELLKTINKILVSNNPIEVRFSGGDTVFDFKLSKKNVEAMKDILDFYYKIIN